ncbi:MAG: hypothetical protein RR478_00835 [Bacilli bacterium]
MSSKEFWEDDPQLYWAYQTFYFKKMEVENARDNQYMWLQGMYIHDAVLIALSKVLGNKGVKYPEKPYELTTPNNKETKNIDEVQEQQFNTWARM